MPDPTPKKELPIDVESLARSYTEMAIKTLAGLMQHGTEEGVQARCAVALLERGWGRPKQENTVKGDLKLVIRQMLDGE